MIGALAGDEGQALPLVGDVQGVEPEDLETLLTRNILDRAEAVKTTIS